MSVIIDDLYFKISWWVSASLKARQFGRIQWDSLKKQESVKYPYSNYPTEQPSKAEKRQRWLKYKLRSRGTQPRLPPKCIENTFSLIQSTFKSLEMHSKRRYKSCFCLVVLGQLESFRNHLGPQHILPKILDAILGFTKVRIFLIPLSISFSNPKILDFLFLRKIGYVGDWNVKN